MNLLHDYILVEEAPVTEKLGDTGLNLRRDDSDRFMRVKILNTSPMLKDYYAKEFPTLTPTEITVIIKQYYTIGNILLINRVAKTPYRDGLFFISCKDVIGVENVDDNVTEDIPSND